MVLVVNITPTSRARDEWTSDHPPLFLFGVGRGWDLALRFLLIGSVGTVRNDPR
jgi:hypothetical protein